MVLSMGDSERMYSFPARGFWGATARRQSDRLPSIDEKSWR